MNKKDKHREKIIIAMFLFVLVVFVFLSIRFIRIYSNNKKLAQYAICIAEKNQEKVFSLKKITLISSASAMDNTTEKNLKSLNLSQFTDIALQIENGEELTNKNTVKELYIDNIEIISKESKGIQFLDYKNYNNFGKLDQIVSKNTNRIDFNIVYTNEENKKANYNNPTFYTDCSNPITLEYVNKDIVTDYKMGENNTVSFDGRSLKSAGVTLDDLETYLRFRVNIQNNLNENYSCWVGFSLPLKDIFEGSSMKAKTLEGEKYNFFCSPVLN